MDKEFIKELSGQFMDELTLNIMPFWAGRMVDDVHGGFYGRIDGHGVLFPDAPKGAVLNARILWSFSAAYRVTGNKSYLDMAVRAKRYLADFFHDKEYGGIYWMLNSDGTPLDDRKQSYAIGFAIYGLSELVRACNDPEALDLAIRLYRDLESHAYDSVCGGYCEAMTRNWQDIEDMRLSEKDANERKTMNTHLHILEPYTNLFRVWPDCELKKRIGELLDIFIDRIYQSDTGHLGLFFTNEWIMHGVMRSYGHDIESSWLMTEAAQVICDDARMERLLPIVRRISDVCAEESLNADGSMIYEFDPENGHRNLNIDWWPQAETVIGYFNSWQLSGNREYLERSLSAWKYIRQNIVDSKGGEWLWGRLPDGEPNLNEDKAGPWKCPYHNSRMCVEIIERLNNL